MNKQSILRKKSHLGRGKRGIEIIGMFLGMSSI